MNTETMDRGTQSEPRWRQLPETSGERPKASHWYKLEVSESQRDAQRLEQTETPGGGDQGYGGANPAGQGDRASHTLPCSLRKG